MCTYSSLVDPTDLCLKLCEAHEQNHIIFPLVAYFFRCRVVCCIRSAGNVGLDTAQHFEFIFWALSTFRGYQGKLNTLPGSTSFHFGATRAPVYFKIPEEARCGGLPWADLLKPCRISLSSRTLVPFRAMGSGPKRQVKIVHDEPESA